MKNRKKVRVEPIIDEYSRFLFLDKKDMPEVVLHWEKHFQWALGKYNRTHEEQMPKIHASCMQAYILFQYGESWNESESTPIFNGTF